MPRNCREPGNTYVKPRSSTMVSITHPVQVRAFPSLGVPAVCPADRMVSCFFRAYT